MMWQCLICGAHGTGNNTDSACSCCGSSRENIVCNLKKADDIININKKFITASEHARRLFGELCEKWEKGNGRYAILGDSITDTWTSDRGASGGASDHEHGYPYILHNYVKKQFSPSIEFDNLGVGGDSAVEAMQRVDERFFSREYDCIGIALGTNNWNVQMPLDKFREDYQSLLELLISNTNAALFLISLGYFESWRKDFAIRESEYNKVIFEMAQRYDLPVIDTCTAMREFMIRQNKSFEDITFEPDPVHPNDLGHAVWAAACMPIFTPRLYK